MGRKKFKVLTDDNKYMTISANGLGTKHSVDVFGRIRLSSNGLKANNSIWRITLLHVDVTNRRKKC
jgi:hypothetical protein